MSSGELALRVLERERPQSVVSEAVYPESFTRLLPRMPHLRAHQEFIPVCEWAHLHKAELREAQPWHAEHPYYNHWCQAHTRFETFRWGTDRHGPRALMDWVSPRQLRAEYEASLPSSSSSSSSSSPSSTPPPQQQQEEGDEGPPPVGLAGRALMFAVSSTVVVCAHIGDWVTRGHPAPRRFLDAVEFLHNRPKYYGSAYHESGVERDLCFIKQLREAKGPKVVGVFGAAHMSGVINLWNEYAGAPFDVWQTTTDGGKDFSREVYKRCRRTVDEWDWREVRRKRGEIVQRALAPLGVDVDLQAWAERRERWAKARRLRYIRSQQKT